MLNHSQHKLYFYMTSRGNGIWQSTWIRDSLNLVKKLNEWNGRSNRMCVCVRAFWWPQCSKIDCTIFEFQTIKLQTHTQHHQREKWLKHKSIQSYTAYALINRVKQIHSHHIHLLILKKNRLFFLFHFFFFSFSLASSFSNVLYNNIFFSFDVYVSFSRRCSLSRFLFFVYLLSLVFILLH